MGAAISNAPAAPPQALPEEPILPAVYTAMDYPAKFDYAEGVTKNALELYTNPNTEVVAPISGTVKYVGWKQSNGYAVEIANEQYTASVYHLDKNISVKAGDKVVQGSKIGTAGTSGSATKIMCTIELNYADGKPVDITSYVGKTEEAKPILPIAYTAMEYSAKFDDTKAAVKNALDLYALQGTEVVSPISGTVTQVGFKGGQGNTIRISNEQYTCYVSHLDKNIAVKIGDTVAQGEKLGLVGTSGTATEYMCTLTLNHADGTPFDVSFYYER